MNRQQANELLQRYRNGECSFEEQQAIEAWIDQEVNIGNWVISDAEKAVFGKRLKERIEVSKKPLRVSRSLKIRRLLAIASILILICSFVTLIYQRQVSQHRDLNLANHIQPGKNSATLTLADGKKILLTDHGNGKLANESGVSISKSADGQIIYEISDLEKQEGEPLRYNTLSTAFGQQYQIRLPDGTRVWLNNGSSLKYPVSFSKTAQRKVELDGEAYFEVSKDPSQPFVVKTSTQEVLVLGTHFNLNAYANEPLTKTTLLEGRVKVNGNGAEATLSPGQQALNNGVLQVRNVDTELAIAWKNNQFMFESENIQNIMRMVERWYNVRVDYEGDIPRDEFSGAVSRFDNLSEVLKILELTGKVHFKVEGRRIMVIK
ncbi:putative anti-sigma factor [Pedobacter sp. BAL39]|uniref:FecR family protein n=1 Tax=Pedobacter sp. BAL39 TaxID=391596 RepID=UPI000155A07E|nr:FecR family protein [Pedobacter sp. BAL39]EDM35124.1 putative anti-sigma factor [Pedobacter sp. BAL39]